MIVIRRSEENIREQSEQLVKDMVKWFEENPKRRVCRTELWYGITKSIRRKYIQEDIDKVVEEATRGRR